MRVIITSSGNSNVNRRLRAKKQLFTTTRVSLLPKPSQAIPKGSTRAAHPRSETSLCQTGDPLTPWIDARLVSCDPGFLRCCPVDFWYCLHFFALSLSWS